jgi:predicted DNA-binding transcriptional regulator AlpA
MSGSYPEKTPEDDQSDATDTKKQVPATHLLSREEIQKEYGLTRRWLELAALKGNGPAYVKIGSRTVRYRRAEIERWLAEREVRSTSEHSSRGTATNTSIRKGGHAGSDRFVEPAKCPGAIAIEKHLADLKVGGDHD